MLWVTLLLIVHFDAFWHVVDLTSVEDWTFRAFLYILSGPILLYFATSVLLAAPADSEVAGARRQYFAVARRFFALLALLQGWMISVDYVYAGLGAASLFGALTLALVLGLMWSRSERVHQFGVGLAWLLQLLVLGLLGSQI